MTREPAFTIIHKPDGKFRLLKGAVLMADFPTKEEAEAGLRRCIKPEAYHYDEFGNLLTKP